MRGSMGKCRDAHEGVKMWAKVGRKVLAQRRKGEGWRRGQENGTQGRAGRTGGRVEAEGEHAGRWLEEKWDPRPGG